MTDGEKKPNGLKIIIITIVSVAVVFSAIIVGFSYYYSHTPFSFTNHSLTESAEYNASDNYTFILSAQSGNVVMVPNDKGIIKVSVETWTYFYASPEVNISETVSNNSYDFSVTSPQTGFMSSTISISAPTNLIAREFNISTFNGGIDFDFPASMNSLSLETTNGRISIISELADNVIASTQNGDIDISLIQTSNISLNSQNGGITMKVTDPITTRTQNTATTNGDITVQINPLSRLSVSAFVTNGDVTTSGLDFVTTVSGSNRLVGTLNGGGGTMSAITVNGDISLLSI